jgi:hypothetical protein
VGFLQNNEWKSQFLITKNYCTILFRLTLFQCFKSDFQAQAPMGKEEYWTWSYRVFPQADGMTPSLPRQVHARKQIPADTPYYG